MLIPRFATRLATFVLAAAALMLTGCEPAEPPAQPTGGDQPAATDDGAPQSLVLYCGRGRSLVEPLILKFEQETGIDVEVRFGETAELAVGLMEEGDQTAADLFWAQDAGALGAVAGEDLFAELPDELLSMVAPMYQSESGQWIATSGRARVLAYAPERVSEDELPPSVFDLTNDKWRGRVGWAPANGSFQAFLTAMRQQHGDERAKQWLADMKANGAKIYPKNTPIVKALADGEIDLGLPNHYYLLRFKEDDPDFPVAQTFFEPGDIGNMILVSGIGVPASSDNRDAAHQFIRYLLSAEAQQFFAQQNHEYPVIDDVQLDEALPQRDRLTELAPNVDLDHLNDLEGTLELLREVNLP